MPINGANLGVRSEGCLSMMPDSPITDCLAKCSGWAAARSWNQRHTLKLPAVRRCGHDGDPKDESLASKVM